MLCWALHAIYAWLLLLVSLYAKLCHHIWQLVCICLGDQLYININNTLGLPLLTALVPALKTLVPVLLLVERYYFVFHCVCFYTQPGVSEGLSPLRRSRPRTEDPSYIHT